MSDDLSERDAGTVDLYWIPLGADAHVVRVSGKVFEAISAFFQRRERCDLYHSALEISVPEGRFVIEQAPVPDGHGEQRGVVAEGPVGTRRAGRFRIFRYEVRRWREGRIPDIRQAIGSPVRLTADRARAQLVLDLLPSIPTPVWGRDELGTGEMWNSNSVISWVLARSGTDLATIHPPSGGRAPGWNAGMLIAACGREHNDAAAPSKPTRRELVGEVRDIVHDLPAFLTAPLYRRRHQHWGATPNEITAPLPGDALLPHAQFRSTRAITIDAPPEAVWPWLVQVGCGRAGFYSDDLLDNLGRPSAAIVMPEFQQLAIGQWVPMSPSATPTDRTAFKVAAFDVNHSLLWSKPDSTWAWSLTPTESNGTRLVTRIHAVYDWSHPLSAVLGVFLMEFGDFAMQRRMLHGIKARAESDDPNSGGALRSREVRA